jgi:cell shape-determining protein MreC
MCQLNKYGFPRTKSKTSRIIKGFQSGDFIKAIIPKGKYKGIHEGRIAIRTNGVFNLSGKGINWKYCKVFHLSDGYNYQNEPYPGAKNKNTG